MKNNILIIFIGLLFITFGAQAQTASTTTTDAKTKMQGYISFGGGVSFPIGDFGKSDYNNNKAGFAKKNATFNLDGAYYFYKGLGIGATFSFQDQGELNNADVTALSNGYNASYASDGSTVTAVNRYRSVNLLAGPQYSFTVKKFIIDVRASAGIIRSFSTPETQTTLVGYYKQTGTFYQRSADQYAFGYGGSLGIRYSIGNNLDLGLKASRIDSPGLNIKTDDRNVILGRYVTKQPISELQTVISLVKRF